MCENLGICMRLLFDGYCFSNINVLTDTSIYQYQSKLCFVEYFKNRVIVKADILEMVCLKFLKTKFIDIIPYIIYNAIITVNMIAFSFVIIFFTVSGIYMLFKCLCVIFFFNFGFVIPVTLKEFRLAFNVILNFAVICIF